MRCLGVIIIGLLVLWSEKNGTAQGISDSIPIIKVRHDLPLKAIKGKYRIQITAVESVKAEKILKDAMEINSKFKLNTYIIKQKNILKLHAGDYSEKKFAKQRLSYIKKKFPKAKVVKTENDSIIEFFVVEKKKPAKSVPNQIPPGNTQKQYIIKIDPPLKTADNLKNKENENPEVNTASNEDYLTDEEKRVYYILNLVRLNPKSFAETYLAYLKNSRDYYESSLYNELQKLKPLPLLKPNRKLYESARCHAEESGKSGYVGHERKKCTRYFMGECCQYGVGDAFEIVVHLLIDQGIPSLGHRKICLSNGYTELGVSIQPHKTYGVNTVMDFR